MNEDNERKDDSKANNWVWYLILSLVVLLAVGAYVVGNNVYRMKYPDLVQLLERTERVDGDHLLTPDVDNHGKIVVTAPDGGTIELSSISDVLVHETYVEGKVYHRKLDSRSPDAEAVQVRFRANRDKSEKAAEQLFGLLDAAKISWDHSQGDTWFDKYGTLLILIAVTFLLVSFIMRRLGGIGSPMSFGRSRGKLYAQDDIGITFDEVAGVDEAVEEVREIVDFLKYPEKYQRLGGRIPKGVLLVGPPGTGKTLLAKAIAGEAGVPYFSLSGSDFVEMFVGVGAARVRDMFQQASAKSPCIIFIDELDALGKSRSNSVVGVHDEREQTLNALLVEMDGFDSNIGIIVIAATNRPETLDSALLRPGRFDRTVLVDRPDKSGREAILKVHIKSVKLGSNVDVQSIASMTSGFCGADLANLVNEAALLAARKGKSTVGQEEFEEGIERVTAGLEKKRRVMDDDEKLRVAYHEAAHALMACSLPNTDPVHKVSIIPRGLAALGYTLQRPEGDRYLMTQAELETQMQVLLAGTLAEEIVLKDISTGAQNDLERASAIARSMVMEFGMSRLGRVNYRETGRSPFLNNRGIEGYGRDYSEQTAREIDEEVRRIVDDMTQRAKHILLERRTALENITRQLLEIEVMDSAELLRIIDASFTGPRVKPGTAVKPVDTKPSQHEQDAPSKSTHADGADDGRSEVSAG